MAECVEHGHGGHHRCGRIVSAPCCGASCAMVTNSALAFGPSPTRPGRGDGRRGRPWPGLWTGRGCRRAPDRRRALARAPPEAMQAARRGVRARGRRRVVILRWLAPCGELQPRSRPPDGVGSTAWFPPCARTARYGVGAFGVDGGRPPANYDIRAGHWNVRGRSTGTGWASRISAPPGPCWRASASQRDTDVRSSTRISDATGRPPL